MWHESQDHQEALDSSLLEMLWSFAILMYDKLYHSEFSSQSDDVITFGLLLKRWSVIISCLRRISRYTTRVKSVIMRSLQHAPRTSSNFPFRHCRPNIRTYDLPTHATTADLQRTIFLTRHLPFSSSAASVASWTRCNHGMPVIYPPV